MPRPCDEDACDVGIRVILLGARELEQSWRRDPRVDVIRARSGFEVIGEVGRPEGRTVVVIDDGRETTERTEAIVSAVRHVDPTVRVLQFSRAASDLRLADDTWDGAVRADSSVDDVLGDLVSALEPVPEPVGARSGPIEVKPSAAPAGTDGRLPGAGDDLALVRRLLAGESIVDPALEQVRRHLGAADLQLVAEAGAETVAVRHRDHLLGHLTGGPHAVLQRAAEWLGPWLALAEQQSQLRHAAFTDPLTGAWN
ncbi:MAG: hypothetical protein KDA21_06065, partial [Phycisphaerales bacterium]|nr:hypothetical protein [Phycisphaerales bacterium]